MKCPEWLLEALAKGEGVKCMVWDHDKEPASIETVVGFGTSGSLFYMVDRTDGELEWFKNAEPYKEPEHEFKPFDKVLVRDDEDDFWRASVFSHKRGNEYAYCSAGHMWRQCIPYEGNEHLLGTIDTP